MSLLMQALKMAEQSRQQEPNNAALEEALDEEAVAASLANPSSTNPNNASPNSTSSSIPTENPLPSSDKSAFELQLNPPPAAAAVPMTDFPTLSAGETELSLLAQEEQLLEDLLAKGEAASWEELPTSAPDNAANLNAMSVDNSLDNSLDFPQSSDGRAEILTPSVASPVAQEASADRLGLSGAAPVPSAAPSSLATIAFDQLELTPLAAPTLAASHTSAAAKDLAATTLAATTLPATTSAATASPASTLSNADRFGKLGQVFGHDQRNDVSELNPFEEKPDDLAGLAPARTSSPLSAPAPAPAPAAATPPRATLQDQAKSVFGAKKSRKSMQPVLIFALSATCAVLIGAYFYLQNQNSSNTLVNLNPVNVPNTAPVNPPANAPIPQAAPNSLAVANVTQSTAGVPAVAPALAATPVPNAAPISPQAAAIIANEPKAVMAPNPAPVANAALANSPLNANDDAGLKASAPKNTAALSARLPSKTQAGGQDIQLARTSSRLHIAPGLESAYRAYQQGDVETAQQAYRGILQQEPNNRDAILGLAASAMRLNNGAEAANLYLRLLELDPNDPDATAGLIGMQQSDPQQAESRLKKILNQHPQSASLHFMLGNVYAQQGRWSDAQQSFFRAFSNAPNNPDYLFNLAVSLDRLGQSKLALDYYQRALQLAQSTGSGFSGSAVQERVRDLQAQLSNNGK